jgi:HEPN domain-containing protein
MNVPDSIRIWTEQAQYDLGTAQAMMRSRRYPYVLFCCQQAVEKTLKAIIVQTTGDFPPRVHQLMRLVGAAKLQPAEDEADFLRELSALLHSDALPRGDPRPGYPCDP